MKSKEKIATGLGISRKSLYNYMNILNIKELDDKNINIIKNYINNKNKSNEYTKSDLLQEIEKLKLENAKIQKENEELHKGQDALLNQIEWYKNDISNELNTIKQNMTLLLEAPKKKKTFIEKLLGK